MMAKVGLPLAALGAVTAMGVRLPLRYRREDVDRFERVEAQVSVGPSGAGVALRF